MTEFFKMVLNPNPSIVYITDVNECELAVTVCYNGGTCYNSYGSFVCRCTPEWTGPTCIQGLYRALAYFMFLILYFSETILLCKISINECIITENN